jgi:hypothetical protein
MTKNQTRGMDKTGHKGQFKGKVSDTDMKVILMERTEQDRKVSIREKSATSTSMSF